MLSRFRLVILSAVLASVIPRFDVAPLYHRAVAALEDLHQHPLQWPEAIHQSQRSLKFVALGDSFAAGPGAGNRVSWWDLFNTCRRSDHSYPAIVSGDTGFDADQRHVFDFRACTGARILDVMRADDGGHKGSQLDSATRKADITTLSISGNDVGFFDILNSCIYHFGGSGSPADCKTALNTTKTILTGPELDKSLDLVIKGALDNAQGAPSPHLFITGYAQFFNEETIQCNNATFCIWENPSKNHTCPSLTQDLRRDINSLIRALNAKIYAATERANTPIIENNKDHKTPTNATVTFVDYDSSFEGHRFCEPQNTEPDFSNPDIWFYQTWGNSGDSSQPPDEIPEPSYTDVDPDTCLDRAMKSGDWGRLAICYMAKAKRDDPDLRPEPTDPGFGNSNDDQVDVEDWSSWITPNQLARIFHPKIGGHYIIAQHILAVLNATTTDQ